MLWLCPDMIESIFFMQLELTLTVFLLCILLVTGKCFTSKCRKALPKILLEYGGSNHTIFLVLVLWLFSSWRFGPTRCILQLFFETTLAQWVLVNQNWFIKYIIAWQSKNYFCNEFCNCFRTFWRWLHCLFKWIGLLLSFLYGLYKLLYKSKVINADIQTSSYQNM